MDDQFVLFQICRIIPSGADVDLQCPADILLQSVGDFYPADVIICGMGGELIADIIAGCRFLTEDTRFILQPMTKAEILRRRLYEDGFEILEERTAYDGKRAYTVIHAAYTGDRREVDEIFALTGKVTDPGFLQRTAEKLLKNASRMDNSDNFTEEAAKLRNMAEEILRKAEMLS